MEEIRSAIESSLIMLSTENKDKGKVNMYVNHLALDNEHVQNMNKIICI